MTGCSEDIEQIDEMMEDYLNTNRMLIIFFESYFLGTYTYRILP